MTNSLLKYINNRALGENINNTKEVNSLKTEVFGESTDIINAMVEKCIGFGSSARDSQNGINGVTYSTTVFYDPVSGNDTYTGTTANNPKKTLPAYLQNSTKYLIKAGTSINLGNSASNYIKVNGSNSTAYIAPYDGVPSSRTFGQEITWQPDPFINALAGKWISQQDKSKYYFKIDTGAWDSSPNPVRGIHVSSSNTLVARGCWIVGATHSGVTVQDGTIRLEDFIIENCLNNPVLPNCYGSVGIRAEHQNSHLSITRGWMRNVGEDMMWLYNGAGHTITDMAIIHTCDKQKYGVQHCDVIQYGPYPGAFIQRRMVVVHKVNGASTLLDSGSSETTAVGACIMSTGPAGTDTPGGLVEDYVFMTNRQGFNFEKQSGVTLRRVVGLLDGASSFVSGQAPLLVWQQTNNVEDGCVFGTLNTTTTTRALFGGWSNSQTTVDLGSLNNKY